MHPDLVKIVCGLNSQGILPVLDTNGIQMDAVFNSLDPGQLSALSFSVDGGTQRTHELIRGRGSFSPTWRNILKAKELGFTTRVTFTVMGVNINEIDLMVEQCVVRLVDTLNLHLYCPVSSSTQVPFFVDPNAWLDKWQVFDTNFADTPIEIIYRKGFTTWAEEDPSECHCFQGDRIQVYPNRTYGRCCLFSGDTKLQGELSAGTLEVVKPDSELLECAPGECGAIFAHPFGKRSPYYSPARRLTCISRKEFAGGLQHLNYSN